MPTRVKKERRKERRKEQRRRKATEKSRYAGNVTVRTEEDQEFKDLVDRVFSRIRLG